jgi:hypothetical protein
MIVFILAALFLVPIGIISGLIALGWFWDFVSSCFFSLSYYCGMGMTLKATIFTVITFGCFAGLVKLWSRAK